MRKRDRDRDGGRLPGLKKETETEEVSLCQVERKETETEEDCSKLRKEDRDRGRLFEVEGKETETEEDCFRLKEKRQRQRKAVPG